jgi:hypothetical protein
MRVRNTGESGSYKVLTRKSKANRKKAETDQGTDAPCYNGKDAPHLKIPSTASESREQAKKSYKPKKIKQINTHLIVTGSVSSLPERPSSYCHRDAKRSFSSDVFVWAFF